MRTANEFFEHVGDLIDTRVRYNEEYLHVVSGGAGSNAGYGGDGGEGGQPGAL